MAKRICDIEWCDKPMRYTTTGFCIMHYHRHKNGLDMNAAFKFKGATFKSRLSIPDETSCWEWTGYFDPNGYGRHHQDWAHRVAYEMWVGPIPAGFHIDHLCRNVKCCNPTHLEAVTPRENMLRGYAPGAILWRANRCARGHEMTAENIYLRPDGKGRQCRACINIRTARRDAKVSAARLRCTLPDHETEAC